ncbi:MAG: tyrosine-type recombinase/integrase [Alphaproteobacteria bacterium]
MAKTHDPNNERIKRRYCVWLKEARGLSEATIGSAAAAIARFERETGYRDFKAFHIEQARSFKRRLRETNAEASGAPLSASSIHGILTALKAFFNWLADQPGYRSRVKHADAAYFSPDRAEAAIAKAHREPRVPTLEQIRHVIRTMPQGSEIERRNRALIAFAIVSGARDRAIATMQLRDVDTIERRVHHDARHVRSKFHKTYTSTFFPVGEDLSAIVIEWITYLKSERLFGLDGPLFPMTRIVRTESGGFAAVGIDDRPWANANAIRAIFRAAFEAAGLPYYNPHSFRHTLAILGEQVCQTPEEFKAWSQNLGHESPLTTFASYGTVPARRQAQIMRGLGRKGDRDSAAA